MQIVETRGNLRLMGASMQDLRAKHNAFRELLPHSDHDSSIHSGEEGRWKEELLAEFLRTYLPPHIQVETGFIYSKDHSVASYQIDILLWDIRKSAPILRYGNAVIVDPACVVGAISVKSNLRPNDIPKELRELSNIKLLASVEDAPKPYTALFAYRTTVPSRRITQSVLEYYEERRNYSPPAERPGGPSKRIGISAAELIDSIVILDGDRWHISAPKPLPPDKKSGGSKAPESSLQATLLYYPNEQCVESAGFECDWRKSYEIISGCMRALPEWNEGLKNSLPNPSGDRAANSKKIELDCLYRPFKTRWMHPPAENAARNE